ncbi:uncharacterized protein LOC110463195 [Mizuhopecten yessoensis]|uniref:Uncharacterized protein n=1 Tax=Mizuhopecten yessoensis TaxID=6573 RepID=A0A210PWN8_MIZYE|nr:uncharacterized protein LOC110463195 [Mizuhopecten yessoensis]OWF40901.1 hypothetical protein KP79_PYT20243 [Mizuhopecten yessoensis]
MFALNLLLLVVFGRDVQVGHAAVVGGISKESMIVPDAFWTFSAQNHEVIGSSEEHGYIRNTTFDTNYPQYTGPAFDRAVQFWGTSSSYIQFPNDQGALDGTDWGAWFFYINIDTDVGEATILEYEGACPGGQGLSIRCINGYIHVSFYTSSGKYETGNSPVKLTPGVWTYIGVTWHYLQPMVYVNYNGAELQQVLTHNLQFVERIEAHGNVKIGGSFTSDTPFRGQIACLWYQKGYFFKKNKTPLAFCDSSLRSNAMSLAVTDIAVLPASGCIPQLVTAPLRTVEERCQVE